MPYKVFLTRDAERDLEGLFDFVFERDSPRSAQRLLDQIETRLGKLADFPERGNHPRELASLGVTDYREVFFKPYRIIYRVLNKRVYIYLIVDGRRDMQTLLQRRLLTR